MRQRPGSARAKPKPWKPTKTQLRSSRAQERAYRSQGKAVQRVATVQKRYGPGVATSGPSLQAAKQREAAQRKTIRVRERQAQIHRRRVTRQRETAARQRLLRNALVQQRQIQQSSKRLRTIAGPPKPSYGTRQTMLKIAQAREGQKSINRVGAAPDLKAQSIPELSRDIRFLRKPTRTQLKENPKRVIDAAGDYQKANAAALEVLEQTTRPVHAIAAGTKAAIKGENVASAAWKGAKLEDKTLFSDVLKEAGVPSLGGARSVAGFLLDVGLDPTTYVSFGATTAARQAALKASSQAAKQAAEATTKRMLSDAARSGKTVSKGQVKREAREAGRQAARRVLDRSSKSTKGKGVEVRLAGKVLPGSRAATAAVGKGVGKVARPITKSKRVQDAAAGARNVASRAHGDIRSARVSAEEEALSKALRRETRSTAERRIRDVNERVNALVGHLRPEEQRLVIDAIESNNLKSLRGIATAMPRRARHLRPSVRPGGRGRAAEARRARTDPDRLYHVARNVRDDLRYLRRIGRRSGLIAGDIGLTARSRREVELSAAATAPVRSTARAEKELAKAEKAFEKAKADLKSATTEPAKRGARQRVRTSGQRVSNLRKEIKGTQRVAEHGAHARREQREIRQRRRGAEAQGYFPRIRSEDVKGSGLLERLNEPSAGTIPKTAVGSNKPQAGAARLRTNRRTRAALRSSEKTRHIAEPLSEDIRDTIASYGRAIGSASAARELNTKIIQQAGRDLPKNLTRADIAAMKANGERIYRVRRGVLEDVTDSPSLVGKVSSQQQLARRSDQRPELLTHKRATEVGGQYKVIRQEMVERIRDRAPGQLAPEIGAVFDKYRSSFKKLALMTPAYLVRNLLGDLSNAYGDEAAFRLAGNFVKGQKVLNELGRYERAQGRFYRALPDGKKTVKLNENQASEVAKAFALKGEGIAPPKEISAMQVARLAEQMGVIRQGRFLELLEEGGKLERGKKTRGWENLTKRVEDSTRIATFLGGLQRGMSPRESAQRASKIHFDYGDLTPFEKRVLRRIAPFYTFTSRNIPLQARTLAKRPGKAAALQKAREEGAKAAGLPEGYEEGLDDYEARQLGIPIKIGDRVSTVSFGSPFVDLNDIVAGPVGLVKGGVKQGGKDAVSAAVNRALELSGGPEKLIPELVANHSFFYRDQIQPDEAPEVRAPEWVQWMGRNAPGFAETVGLQPFVDPEGNETLGWGKKTDYAFRNLAIGPIGAVLRSPPFGTEGRSARDMTPAQSIATSLGVRSRDYDPVSAKRIKLRKEFDELKARQTQLNRHPHPSQRQSDGRPYLINQEHPTKEYTEITARLKQLQARMDELQRKATPRGFQRGRPIAERGESSSSSSSTADPYVDALKAPVAPELQDYIDALK